MKLNVNTVSTMQTRN